MDYEQTSITCLMWDRGVSLHLGGGGGLQGGAYETLEPAWREREAGRPFRSPIQSDCSLLFQSGRFVWVNGKSTSLPFPQNRLLMVEFNTVISSHDQPGLGWDWGMRFCVY